MWQHFNKVCLITVISFIFVQQTHLTNPTNAPVAYHPMHHFVTEMCTHVHISVKSGALWNMGLVHCVIYAIGLLLH